jgi:hypothetical protein
MKGWELLDTLMFPFQTHGGVCVIGRTYDVSASGCFKKKWKKYSLRVKEIVWTWEDELGNLDLKMLGGI